MTQTKMAELLGVAQSEISKIEHRTDLYISTLAEYVEAPWRRT
jgi:transcriptional regulator with XRE-family HTH domain